MVDDDAMLTKAAQSGDVAALALLLERHGHFTEGVTDGR